jgi:drug/metabolite transporter (DMT)-like permease
VGERRGRVPWLVRSVIAGAAGTAAMTLAYATERRLRPDVEGPLDYDDSLVPGQIVGGVLHLPDVTPGEEYDLGMALRWGYGSAFGIYHGTLRKFMSEPWASLVFGATLMTATLSLFPLMGRTPPPWKWPPSVIMTAVGTHAAYVAAMAIVDDRLNRV